MELPVLELRVEAPIPVDRSELAAVLETVAGVMAVLPEAQQRALDGAPNPLEASVSLVDDDAMSHLNQTYRGRPGTTDVLSFAQGEGEGAALIPWLLGDVVISVGRTASQASANGWRWLDEFRFLLIHGVLHLLGYDHIEDDDRNRMETMEQRLWKACGGQGTLRAERLEK